MANAFGHDADDDVQIISFSDDAAVIDAWRSVRPDQPVILIFGEPELAAIFRGQPQVVSTVAWLPALARRITAAMPPRPRATIASSPIVIGDGRIARHLVEALVEGWADPGQPLEIHCLGAEPAWAQEAELAVEARGRLTWSELPMRPVTVARRCRDLAASWQVPKRKKGDATGPTVLIALDVAEVAMSVAVAVEALVPKARVGVMLDQADHWPPVRGVTVFDLESMRRELALPPGGAETILAEHLLEEVAWVGAPGSLVTRPEVPIFATAEYAEGDEPVPFAEQPVEVRDQLEVVAAAVPVIAAAGSLELADRAPDNAPVVLTPGELLGMAREILRVLGVEADRGTQQTAVELAYLLPSIAGRAGQPLQRPKGYVSLLTFDDIERLAPLVHLAYQDVSAETKNATDSPLAGELWDQLTEFDRAGNRAVLAGAAVCHAVLGLDWREAGESAELVLDSERIEILAELEHRRWATYQRRNGAPDHEWMKPWNGPEDEAVNEGAKKYDRHIVRHVARFLRGAGVEVIVAR